MIELSVPVRDLRDLDRLIDEADREQLLTFEKLLGPFCPFETRAPRKSK